MVIKKKIYLAPCIWQEPAQKLRLSVTDRSQITLVERWQGSRLFDLVTSTTWKP